MLYAYRCHPMTEQTRIGRQRDPLVAERTRELAEANEALKQELAVERQRTEAARRASDQDSRVIVRSMPGMVAILTPTGGIDAVNDELVEYSGRTLEELQQWGTSDTVHPDDLPRLIQIFTKAIASGEPYEVEVRLRRFDGAYRWFHDRAVPRRDASGAILRWYVLQTDIDDRKRMEDALRHSEARLRAIVETTPECVHVIAGDGTLLSVNAAGAAMAGASSVDRMLGRNFYDFVTPEDRERYRAFNESVCAGQKGLLEFHILRMDGERLHLETHAAPLRNDNGTVAQLGVARDITARKQAEARLRESERNLRQLTETIPVMLWSATPEGAIDYYNARFLEYTGFFFVQAEDGIRVYKVTGVQTCALPIPGVAGAAGFSGAGAGSLGAGTGAAGGGVSSGTGFGCLRKSPEMRFTSMRLFFSRPSSVSLSAMKLVGPYPLTVIR